MFVPAQPELPVPDGDADDIRRRADEIVSRPEFSDEGGGVQRALDWVGDLIGDILSRATSGGAGSVVALVMGGLALVALLRFLAGLRTVSGLARVAHTEAVVRTTGPAATEHRSGAEWRAEARRLEADGAWDEALRAQYRAVLADLIDGGLVEDVPGRTPGEYRRELAGAAPTMDPPFSDLTELFESVWYGPVDARAGDLETFRAGEARLLAVPQP